MPIYNKPIQTPLTSSLNEINDHTSEAAKLKRAREQAYFNSYDFDAIEVLPYDDDNDILADDINSKTTHSGGINFDKPNIPGVVSNHKQQQLQHQKHQKHNQKPFSLSTKHNKQTTLRHLPPLSPKSQKRLQNASISSKSISDSSVPSTSSSCSDESHHLHPHSSINIMDRFTASMPSNELKYLQHFGSLLRNSDTSGGGLVAVATTTAASTAHKRQRNEDIKPRELVLDVRNGIDMVDDNFLLPRAMIKYHGGSTTNSMPLTEIHAENGKFLHSSQANNTNFMMMMTNKQGNTGFPSKNQTTSFTAVGTNETPTSKEGKIASASSVAANVNTKATTLSNQLGAVSNNNNKLPENIPQRTKKQSTSSTITTTASIISHNTQEADEEDDNDEGNHHHGHHLQNEAVVVDMGDDEDEADDEDLKILKRKSTLRPNLSRSTITSSSLSSSGGEHGNGRSQSHQSHYSTDKSGAGSSGYYSSNVCSTYSLDEHIYCEPIVDIINGKPKATSAATATAKAAASKPQALAAKANSAGASLKDEMALAKHYHLPQTKKALAHVMDATSRTLEMQRSGQSKRKRGTSKKTSLEKKDGKADKGGGDDDDDEDAKETEETKEHLYNFQGVPKPFNESLRVLEASIENLDRHLKNFPHFNAQEHIVSFVQTHSNFHLPNDVLERNRLNKLLPTIMEGHDASLRKENLWKPDLNDDSLLDIDLDSFLLRNDERKADFRHEKTGLDNPAFLITDEQEENHYKCAKYINSCPEDAYYVDNDLVSTSTAGFVKRYEDQLHFQNTRELLEDVRDKIRTLSKSRNCLNKSDDLSETKESKSLTEDIPKELQGMIKTLKQELESYLDRMNQHSELEIRQLCSGLTKSQHIVKMKKAFERRRSLQSVDTNDTGDFATYEAIRDGIFVNSKGLPVSVRHEVTSIRCASDPNFKMKRKSISEIFPLSDCYIETTHEEVPPYSREANEKPLPSLPVATTTQLQRNLSFHKPVLSQFSKQQQQQQQQHQENHQQPSDGNSNSSKTNSEDKDPLASWHRKKPSIWEMYYGTNRLNQTLLDGKRNNGVIINSNQVPLSYPSSRPESDFTLDLPRAEQLRIKMEKEKKFRQRCRYITTFLSLVFFLLTVMVVSLVLTRGKKMFGSMI